MSRALLERYFTACSNGSLHDVVACFTEEAVIYDTNHPRVVGREAIGHFWGRVREKWHGASWEVNTFIGDDAGAAAEWTMHGRVGERPFTVRGSDHYEFEDGRIARVRQYWTFDPEAPGSELIGFPYDEDHRFSPSA